MSTTGFDGRGPVSAADDLAALLGRSATGDTDAFVRFYDLTSTAVYRYARLVSADESAAAALCRDLYLHAWAEAARQPASGVSPVAWLLACPTGRTGR